jgi:hypothetical protein
MPPFLFSPRLCSALNRPSISMSPALFRAVRVFSRERKENAQGDDFPFQGTRFGRFQMLILVRSPIDPTPA